MSHLPILKRSRWAVLKSEAADSAFNMALDETLLEQAAAIRIPILRFYSWSEPAASFGYFQRYQEICSWTALRPLVRRPTGGGLVPHDRDWTYSVIIPPRHPWHALKAVESYQLVHEWVGAAFERLSVQTQLAPEPIHAGSGRCFLGAEQFDLLLAGRKIAGAAQRRNKLGLLIQGSIQETPSHLKRLAWEASVVEQIDHEPLQGADDLVARARLLALTKYSQDSYNQRR